MQKTALSLDPRVSTLENARRERARILRAMEDGVVKETPRWRLYERQLDAVDSYIAFHKTEANIAQARINADNDRAETLKAEEVARGVIRDARKKLKEAEATKARLQERIAAASAELAQISSAARDVVTEAKAKFDASMRTSDEQAQQAAAESLSDAKRAASLVAGGASAHPLQLRIDALTEQSTAAETVRKGCAGELADAERALSECHATLAQIDGDCATNAALEAFVNAAVLNDRSKNFRRPVFFFWAPSRCYASELIDNIYGALTVSERGVDRLIDVASLPSLRALDLDPEKSINTNNTAFLQ